MPGLNLTQVVDLPRGWTFVEIEVKVEPWPGFASVLVSPEGDIAIMGDSGERSYPFDERDVDLAWARRVIDSGKGTWPDDAGIAKWVAETWARKAVK